MTQQRTGPIRRVRVTHPRTDATPRMATRPATREIDEQTRLGEVYMSALVRSQRHLAVLTCGLAAALLGGIALLGALVPGFGRARLGPVPVPWLVLGVLVYPALMLLARFTVRHAERNERDFTDLLRER